VERLWVFIRVFVAFDHRVQEGRFLFTFGRHIWFGRVMRSMKEKSWLEE
jgi:hypothetical protein